MNYMNYKKAVIFDMDGVLVDSESHQQKVIKDFFNNETNYDVNKLEKAILAVQETTDRMKEVSKEEAKMIIEEAKSNANSIVHEALIRAEKVEQERILLEKNMRVYKERVKSLLEAQLKIADDLDKIEL